MFIGQFLRGNSMGPIKIHNCGNYAHAQDSDTYNSLRVKIQLTLEGTFIGQFLKGCNIGAIQKFNRGKLRNYFAIVISP